MMNSKSLLIAIAAFAVTATGAQAYYMGGGMLSRAGLSAEQQAALEEARSLREAGEEEKARDLLVEAGIDEDTLAKLRKASLAARAAIHDALEANDFTAFKLAVADSPLADIITSESDFALFREAHELKAAGEYGEAQEIFLDLGVPQMMGWGNGTPHHEHPGLSADQREALRVARQANDHETVHAILDEAGVRKGWRHHGE